MKTIVMFRNFANKSNDTHVLLDNANLTVNRGFLDMPTLTIPGPCSVGPCHHSVVLHLTADKGNCFHMWKISVNILNKLSPTAEKE
jgi:hypothetical protein